MIRLHDYAASGNCYKVRLLLALLGRPYERVAVDIFAGDTLRDDYAALNPLRETPVLETADGEVIAQSGAILWYLGEGTPFVPDTPLLRARVVQWLAFEQERIMSGVGGARFRILTGREAAARERVSASLALGGEGLDALDGHLAGREWVVGEGPTIADVALFGYAHVAPDAGCDLERRPAVARWLERMRALPGFVDDLVPYPENARPGAGRSIYD